MNFFQNISLHGGAVSNNSRQPALINPRLNANGVAASSAMHITAPNARKQTVRGQMTVAQGILPTNQTLAREQAGVTATQLNSTGNHVSRKTQQLQQTSGGSVHNIPQQTQQTTHKINPPISQTKATAPKGVLVAM